MITFLIDKFDYDVIWRYRITMFIRSVVMLLLLSLFVFVFNNEWQEREPITGNYNDYITIDGMAVREDIRILEKSLKKLPEWLVKSHRENGGIITLRSEPFPNSDYTEYGEGNRVLGTFRPSNNYITLLNEKELIESTLFHEYGHYLDKLFSISESTEFQEIYQDEKADYYNYVEENTYHTSCESEYIAGAFSMYFTQEKKLKKSCPLTYEFIKKMIERN